MFDFFRSLFRSEPPSGTTAKERLRLVLLSDHLSLAPDVVDALKRDLLEVISRYVEIDTDHADVTFEHREREVAMLASIPITGMRNDRRAEPALVTAQAAAEQPALLFASTDGSTGGDSGDATADVQSEVERHSETVEAIDRLADDSEAAAEPVQPPEPADPADPEKPADRHESATEPDAVAVAPRPRRRRRRRAKPPAEIAQTLHPGNASA